jgi:hypothetical protein
MANIVLDPQLISCFVKFVVSVLKFIPVYNDAIISF